MRAWLKKMILWALSDGAAGVADTATGLDALAQSLKK